MAKGNTQKGTKTQPLSNLPAAISDRAADAAEAEASGPSISDEARASILKSVLVEPDEPLINIAAQGRDVLLERLRIHQARQEAAKAEEHKPPPLSDKMREKINAEIEAGRRAQARHQALADLRPKPTPEVWDGKNEVVQRAGNLVPDPGKTPNNTSVSGTFAAGHRPYSPDV